MSMSLVILGLLMEGEKHPYEIQQIMKQRNMDRYIKFHKGSLYYAVEQMARNGLIESAGTVRDSSRPDRTVYRITDRGKERFHQLMEEQILKMEPYYDPIYAALAFARHGDREKIQEALTRRTQMTERVLSEMQRIYDSHNGRISEAALHIMGGGLTHTRTELEWLRAVCKDAEQDRL